jgi:copper oxidase (laccase) domain-containing protein
VDPERVIPIKFGFDGNDPVIRLNGKATQHNLRNLESGVRCEGAYAEKPISLFGVVADCYPVAWETEHFFGLSHHGRTGIRDNLVAQMAEAIVAAESHLGVQRVRFRFWVGPGICASHYEVGETDAAEFSRHGWGEPFLLRSRNEGKYLLDLQGTLLEQLDTLSDRPAVVIEKIDVDGRCTVEAAELFSDRAERYLKTKPYGRNGIFTVSG